MMRLFSHNKTICPFLFVCCIFAFGCSGQQKQNKSIDEIEDYSVTENRGEGGEPVFPVTEHDFGTIERGEEVGARFGFENKGHSPLIIERVVTGCGCTVAKYSEKPVKPASSGFVEVVFDSGGKSGAQFQQVSVYFQSIKKPVRLTLIAQVTKK